MIARAARADAYTSYRACRAALVGLRERSFDVRVLEEDEPLFLATELRKSKAVLYASVELLPSGARTHLEIRIEGEVPLTGLSALLGNKERAREQLKRVVLARIRRELDADLESSELVDEVHRALVDTRELAAHRREKKAEVASAFAAGLISEKERDQLWKRID